MIGVVVSSKREWKVLLDIYNIDDSVLEKYPFGEFYRTMFNNNEVVFFRSSSRKISSSAALQYMIDRFSLKKVIIVGTCEAVNESFNYLDVFIPERVIDYDSLIRELSYDIDEELFIDIEPVNISGDYLTGILGTSDKTLVTWKDLTYLAAIGVDASDTQTYAICKVCQKNNIKVVVLKGISDRPIKNSSGYDEQIDVYEENVPIVMKKIIEDYLPEVM